MSIRKSGMSGRQTEGEQQGYCHRSSVSRRPHTTVEWTEVTNMAVGCIDMHSGINLFLGEAAGIPKAHADATPHTLSLPDAGDEQSSET